MWGGFSLHFWFAFPQWLVRSSTFHMLIGYLCIFIENVSIQSCCPFSNWFLCCYWVVCVFWIFSLIRYIICKYFLSFCGPNFYSVEGVFWGQKAWCFMKFNLSILLLLPPVLFRSYSGNHCQIWGSEGFVLRFILRVQ